MRLTHFARLRHATSRLAAGEGVSALAAELARGQLVVDPDQLVFGSSGIYFLRPDGALTRVLFLRADQDIDDRDFSALLGSRFHHGGFDQDEVVAALRPYHLIECPALVEAALHDWPGEYSVTQRGDGRVQFAYTRAGRSLLDVEDQRLRPCPDCLARLNKRRRGGYQLVADHFTPAQLFADDFARSTVASVVQGLACRSVPDVLRVDWARIEAKYLAMAEYQCQGERCPQPDLSAKSLRGFLHLHYQRSDPDAGQFGYLRALCLGCHAREPGHGYLRQRPDFKRYSARLSSLSRP